MFQESENLQWRIRQAFGEFDDDGLSVVELAYAIAGRLKDSLSQHSEEVAILRSKIDTMHRLMVTAEKRGASQEAEPVASSDVASVELLVKIERVLSTSDCWTHHNMGEELRAIIDNKGAT